MWQLFILWHFFKPRRILHSSENGPSLKRVKNLGISWCCSVWTWPIFGGRKNPQFFKIWNKHNISRYFLDIRFRLVWLNVHFVTSSWKFRHHFVQMSDHPIQSSDTPTPWRMHLPNWLYRSTFLLLIFWSPAYLYLSFAQSVITHCFWQRCGTHTAEVQPWTGLRLFKATSGLQLLRLLLLCRSCSCCSFCCKTFAFSCTSGWSPSLEVLHTQLLSSAEPTQFWGHLQNPPRNQKSKRFANIRVMHGLQQQGLLPFDGCIILSRNKKISLGPRTNLPFADLVSAIWSKWVAAFPDDPQHLQRPQIAMNATPLAWKGKNAWKPYQLLEGYHEIWH